MHFNISEKVENIWHIAQARPVKLHIGARGEMAIAAIITLGDVGEAFELAG